MFEAFAKLFHLIENLYSRDAAIWMVIVAILAIIRTGLNATGVPDTVTKKVGENKWITFKFR